MVSDAWCRFIHMRHELRGQIVPRRYYTYTAPDLLWRDEMRDKALINMIEQESLNE